MKTLTLNVSVGTLEVLNMSDAEYFFDADPGEGIGKPLQPVNGVFNSSSEQASIENVDTSNLSIANHKLGVRMRDYAGNWGTVKQLTLRVIVKNDVTSIAGGEFFFNIAPGTGNDTPMNANDGTFNAALEEVAISNFDTSELLVSSNCFQRIIKIISFV